MVLARYAVFEPEPLQPEPEDYATINDYMTSAAAGTKGANGTKGATDANANANAKATAQAQATAEATYGETGGGADGGADGGAGKQCAYTSGAGRACRNTFRPRFNEQAFCKDHLCRSPWCAQPKTSTEKLCPHHTRQQQDIRQARPPAKPAARTRREPFSFTPMGVNSISFVAPRTYDAPP